MDAAFIETWPEESREAAQLVLDVYGEPDEACSDHLIWHAPGEWKRIVAYKDFDKHEFPAPHTDSVESFIDYAVPVEKFCDLAKFDGSVVANRTRGELSARCHDEQANNLALNLAHDIVTGKKTPEEAREYYAHEFLAYRRKEPTPYMDKLQFKPQGQTGDPDVRLLSDTELRAAVNQGEEKMAQ